MILNTVWGNVYYLTLFICCGFAIFHGARSEYFGVAIMMIGSLLTLVAARLFGTSWAQIEVGIFLIDIAVLIAFVWLALTSDRYWPIWASAFQLLAVIIHTSMLTAPLVTPWAFGTGVVFWAYPMLLALAIGSLENRPIKQGRKIESG